MPEAKVAEEVSDTTALDKLVAKMRETGHQLVRGMRGNDHGLKCLRCFSFHNHKEFGKWSEPCKPKQKVEAVVSQQAAKKLHHNLEYAKQFAGKTIDYENSQENPP